MVSSACACLGAPVGVHGRECRGAVPEAHMPARRCMLGCSAGQWDSPPWSCAQGGPPDERRDSEDIRRLRRLRGGQQAQHGAAAGRACRAGARPCGRARPVGGWNASCDWCSMCVRPGGRRPIVQSPSMRPSSPVAREDHHLTQALRATAPGDTRRPLCVGSQLGAWRSPSGRAAPCIRIGQAVSMHQDRVGRVGGQWPINLKPMPALG